MANTIDYAVKYGEVIEKFVEESKSGRMVNNDYDFSGAKTVKVYNISTSKMNDYKRTGNARYGAIEDLNATTEEMVMGQDRAFTFAIDKLDAEETGGAMQAGTALQRQLREVVIPEIDTYRYAKMVEKAGTTKKEALTKDNIYDAIIDATVALDDKEVPFGGRFLLVTPATFKLMKANKEIVLDTEIGQEMRLRGVIAILDGMEVVQVPSSRLPEGFNFLAGHSVATTAPVKLAEYKVHQDAPGISGSLVEGRVYYDAFVLDKRKDALYAHLAGA